MDIKKYIKKKVILWAVIAVMGAVSSLLLYKLIRDTGTITYNKYFVGIISLIVLVLSLSVIIKEIIFIIEYVAYRKGRYIIKPAKSNKIFIKKLRNMDKQMGYKSLV